MTFLTSDQKVKLYIFDINCNLDRHCVNSRDFIGRNFVSRVLLSRDLYLQS